MSAIDQKWRLFDDNHISIIDDLFRFLSENQKELQVYILFFKKIEKIVKSNTSQSFASMDIETVELNKSK